MNEPTHENLDPQEAEAAARRIAAIRAWQKERLEDLASGIGGFAHRKPALRPPAESSDHPEAASGGLVGETQQAAQITPAALIAETPIDHTAVNADRTETAGAPSAEIEERPRPTPADQPVDIPAPRDTAQSHPDQAARSEERLQDTAPEISNTVGDPESAHKSLSTQEQAQAALSREPGNQASAEKQIPGMEYALDRARHDSDRATNDGRRILLYEIAWLVALIAGLLLLPGLRILPDAYRLIASGLIGGLGATVGAVMALWQQTGLGTDSPPRPDLWYYSQPVTGIPLGGFVFLVLNTAVVFSAGTDSAVLNPALIYAACAYAGFRQGALTDFSTRIRRM